MEPTGGTIFREVQHFGAAVRWLLVGLMAAVAVVSCVAAFYAIEDASNVLGAVMSVAFGVVVPVGASVLLVAARLETEVRPDGLYVRFFPFHLAPRKIEIGQMEECFTRTYAPLREYGGWGIRWGRNGRAYNVHGDRGVQLVFRGNDRLLIGSQAAEEQIDSC